MVMIMIGNFSSAFRYSVSYNLMREKKAYITHTYLYLSIDLSIYRSIYKTHTQPMTKIC